jgi:two-component system NtrC family response regulator
MSKKTILIVEDNDGLREQMKWALNERYAVVEAHNAETCLAACETHRPAAVCLDMGLDNIPDKGLELIDAMLLRDRLLKIIVITANTDETLGPRSIERGALDYFAKPIDIEKLQTVIERAVHVQDMQQQSEERKPERGALSSDSEFFMIGASEPMLQVFDYIRRLSRTDVNVLITGESGTGKELCARAIHFHSPRKDHPFVPINCGAIPENLIESELFGYVKGAFTGADNDKAGLIEAADNGTLLLDEIGEMPRTLQVKLLRFLEDQKVQRLGDTRFRSVNVRIIAATNRPDISQSDGDMRSDLYYRLSEFQIDLPPLRERGDDVVAIAEAIIERNRERFTIPRLALSSRAQQALKGYAWPGNVRELENKLSRAAITCENQTVEPRDLQLSAASMSLMTLKEARDMFERDFVSTVLSRAENNIAEAARLAGVSRPTLYDLIRKHGIETHAGVRAARS